MSVIGITMGDASGVGPEILLRTFQAGKLTFPYVVFGDLEVLTYCNRALTMDVPWRKVDYAQLIFPDVLNVVDLGLIAEKEIQVGVVDRLAGAAARAYVEASVKAALAGDIAAVVTLPINKEATQLTDPGFQGHTEFISELCGVEDGVMMLVGDKLIVTHVSTHVPLATALQRVEPKRIGKVIRLTHEMLSRLRPRARIAVAGLNPHAGEHGLFGNQEEECIAPAIREAQAEGMDVSGPEVPDTLFYRVVHRDAFDAVVCMYHDQGHIPMKLLDFDGAVNMTLGLPIIRTSVDHGTAFDIAYQGKASTRSFEMALALAEKLAAAGSLEGAVASGGGSES